MKKIAVLLSIFFYISCFSQQNNSISLEEFAQYYIEGGGMPKNTTHVKDIHNQLDKFQGIWVGTYNNRTFELHIEKKVDFQRFEYSLFKDLLIVRFKVTDAQNGIIYNTLNAEDNDTFFRGLFFSPMGDTSVYMLYYIKKTETNCGDSGTVYLKPDLLSLNGGLLQIKLSYNPEERPRFCTDTPDYMFPTQTDMVLTKQ